MRGWRSPALVGLMAVSQRTPGIVFLALKGELPRVSVIVSKSCEQRPSRLCDRPVLVTLLVRWWAHPLPSLSFSMDTGLSQSLADL